VCHRQRSVNFLRSHLLTLILAALVLAGYAAAVSGDCEKAHNHTCAAENSHADAGSSALEDGEHSHSSPHHGGASCECLCHVLLLSEDVLAPAITGIQWQSDVIFGEWASIPSDVEPGAIDHPPQLA
jgi:hypothetical protein